LELARHPDELERLRKALKGTDDFLAHEILKDVVREGMRLRPVLPGVGVRTTGRDFYLNDKTLVIPKGSQVLFPTMILTRHEAEYDFDVVDEGHPEFCVTMKCKGARLKARRARAVVNSDERIETNDDSTARDLHHPYAK
jgi:hypothetical protein